MINNKEYKIGDIIYPFYNGTLGFFKRPIWKVVIEIDKKLGAIKYEYWYRQETASLRSMIIKLENKLKNKRRGK